MCAHTLCCEGCPQRGDCNLKVDSSNGPGDYNEPQRCQDQMYVRNVWQCQLQVFMYMRWEILKTFQVVCVLSDLKNGNIKRSLKGYNTACQFIYCSWKLHSSNSRNKNEDSDLHPAQVWGLIFILQETQLSMVGSRILIVNIIVVQCMLHMRKRPLMNMEAGGNHASYWYTVVSYTWTTQIPWISNVYSNCLLFLLELLAIGILGIYNSL